MSKTDVSFRPKNIRDINPKYVPPATTKKPDKGTMELVWHNCATCQPDEEFVSGLYVTDGRGIFLVDWWRTAGYRNGNFVIDPTKDKSENWWWSDLRQTTIGFFKKMK